MKLLPILCLSATAAALPASVDVSARASISKVDGLKFNIDGTTKYYAGTNSYWMPFLTNDTDVDIIMSHLAASGTKILRVWGFNDVEGEPDPSSVYFQSFSGSTATINTGANGLQRLDAVVASASTYGIKLIIPFVNNWQDYGGMHAYFRACDVLIHAQWYTKAECQAMYQAYIAAVISRYRDSPAIFAWELANEPRCRLCPTSILTNWIRQTSDYVRSLDPEHMITVGDEGFGLEGGPWFQYPYWYIEGIDWAANLALPNISFGTFHLYPEHWLVGGSFGDEWITSHAEICARIGKPCLLEEYGVSKREEQCAVEGAWQETSLGLGGSGMAGDLFWQLGDTVVSSGEATHDDGFTVYYGSEQWKCLVDEHVESIG
ncbi:glycoside hydrolase family 5 protein [Bipolaris victoriae FI3]|uniref:mannan endo-1,4-beta-mannosidase n=2 Tax=Bipolaris TaxID=33194 RepID=W6XSE3_COCC2|nr:glycoside hydrolase family 5 protein [Bipolaris zeicola 26-R-13]XP_014557955.1 glycoside hydrolase family 5 protein [Bipolaris victoriae FI3]EUC30487.1 glycoside hydrolase family 5 protein [Bipolaris zeicola 26-R-13]